MNELYIELLSSSYNPGREEKIDKYLLGICYMRIKNEMWVYRDKYNVNPALMKFINKLESKIEKVRNCKYKGMGIITF